MSHYQAPVQEMQFVLFDVFDAPSYWQSNATLAEMLDSETASAIIEESAKITTTVIAPHSRQADEQGVVYKDGAVSTPASYKEAYAVIAEGGWTGLTGDLESGGMGMPKVLGVMFDEMLCAADLSFSLYVSLASAAALTLYSHGSDELKALYLPKLYSGQWTGTMCLTEAHAGTDLGLMHTKAVPADDGSYRISGTKIFITAGEHDLTENIVHLVLAKLPDAPAGTRGISLFLVPKFKLDGAGNLAERNALMCGSVEHKMGITASATCVMNFDGATGYLIGEVNKGLACMFTMMNYERLSMGSQGLGCAERSYQNALIYAKERLQGRDSNPNSNHKGGAAPLIVHADVRRMLLNMKSLIEAGRAFNTYVAMQLDQSHFAQNPADQQHFAALAALLTPIAKAFVTDMGLDICVTGQQIFGGHGYIREWGQEQLVRDVRISQIYEGTNGIQALDLIGRKIIGDNGQTVKVLFGQIQACIDGFAAQDLGKPMADQLNGVLATAQRLTDRLIALAKDDPNEAFGAAVDYLHLIGYLLYGFMWLKIVSAASSKDEAFYQQKCHTAGYYFARILPRVSSLAQVIEAGAQNLYWHSEADF